jgi:uncharacterized protein (DUF433 family)
MTVLLAFTLEHAARVTQLSERRIRYWNQTDVVKPSLANEATGGAYGRIYSFQDLVALRTVAQLRDKFGVSLQKLREVGCRLHQHADRPWSELRFYASGKHLFFQDPQSKLLVSALSPGQMPLLQTLDLLAVARETAERANRLVERQESDIGRVATNRYVASNRPVIAGTRIPTEAIWDFHEDGYGIKEIIAEYPRLTSKDIKAAIEFELDRRATKRAS